MIVLPTFRFCTNFWTILANLIGRTTASVYLVQFPYLPCQTVRVSITSETTDSYLFSFAISFTIKMLSSFYPLISAAETQENRWHGLLLTEYFYNYCVNTFSDPTKVSDSNSRQFHLKHLNIRDPLKEFNNLGRSVTKGTS